MVENGDRMVRLLALLAALSMVALPACARPDVESVDASAQSRFRLTLVGRGNIPKVYIDEGESGAGAGDSHLYRGRVADEDGEIVGRVLARADVFSRRGWAQYRATFRLWGKGTILAEGEFENESPDQDHGTLVVDGGTGHFRTASGTVQVWGSNRGITTFRFHLR